MALEKTGRTPRPRRGRPLARGQLRRGAAPTRARLLALRVLERVERGGAYADLTLHAALARSSLVPSDRALATELVYGTLRWRGRLDYLLAQVVEGDAGRLEPIVTTLLRLGAYQIVCCDRVTDAAAVDQTVRCARAAGIERATGLVNAVLRRLARERDRVALPEVSEDPLGHLVHALSIPDWIAEAWLRRFGPSEAVELARASNGVPPLTVRANPLRNSRDELLEEIGERFPHARPCRHAPRGLVLGHGGHPGLDPAFVAGRFTVQDEASQLVAALLEPRAGERVLDLCAAPGTKTTALAEELGEGGEIVAVDRHARRLGLVGRDARRLGLSNVTTLVRDATQDLCDLAAAGTFDRALVDAPCSGLGTLRRNPDARWRLRPGDSQRFAETQRALLRSAAPTLRVGGALVYSTCTLAEEENEAVVGAFLAEARNFKLLSGGDSNPAIRPLVDSDGFLRSLPHRHDTDGFFAARLERTA